VHLQVTSHGPQQPAPGRTRALLAIASGVAVSLLAGCGHVDPARPTVPLLPDAAAAGGTWRWTPGCPFLPSAPRACERANPNLGSAQLNGDEWNLGAGSAPAGSVTMSVRSPGAVTVRGDLQAAPPCTQSTCIAPSANTWVRGYPNVLYGINQCHAHSSPPQSPGLRLPVRVAAIPADLFGTTSYTSSTRHVTYDIAYDMWLNNSATKTPCTTNGTVEVMVWTDYDRRALLPDSVKVGTASVPFAVDGVSDPGTQAWSVYATNIDTGGRTVPWGGTIWFVLNRADVVSKGTVSVDLSSVLSSAGTLLENNYGWSNFGQNYWLDTIPFGIEYGPESGGLFDAGPSYFSLNVSSYCLDVARTSSEATC
jgi:hypothetical protein